MAIQQIQPNIMQNQPSYKQKKTVKPYLQATGEIKTKNNMKPLPGRGHLVHDNPIRATRYIFKDAGYTLKSVKDGLEGNANDHKLGRINNFALRLTGLTIATYLASRTNDPRAKAMEFVGLATFLLSMDLYPKIAINLPARVVHGFDIDKQYIDDQGRKKSVFQDSNYIPYDLYRGEAPGEDLDEIGDRMRIPTDIVNRHDIIKEKMRKVATQNNALWMLTAGFATPVMSALACYGLEDITGSVVEKIQNNSANRAIKKSLKSTQNMTTDINSLADNSLSKAVKNILVRYEGKEISQEELSKVVMTITANLDNLTAQNIEKDINQILANSAGGELNKEDIKNALAQLTDKLYKTQNGEAKYKNLIPDTEELMSKIGSNTSNGRVTREDIIKSMSEVVNGKTLNGKNEEISDMLKADVLDEFKNFVPSQNKKILSKESIDKITDVAKVIGDYKDKFAILDKASSKKFAHAPETILARSYDKFTKTLFNELGISYKDMKKMRTSDEYTKEILDKKLNELCQDDAKYQRTMKKLGKVISDMEIKLNGGYSDQSYIKDLITSFENLYNNTAKRLDNIGVKNTADALVKEDVSTLKNSVNSVSELFDLFDGTTPNKMQELTMKNWDNFTQVEKELYKQYQSNGLGSAKNIEINTIVERYQGAKNNFNRILHTMDIYKTALTPEVFSSNPEYAKELISKSKEVLLEATPSDYTLKLETNNNPNFYKDLMSTMFANESTSEKEFWSTHGKGRVTQSTKDALSKFDTTEKGNVLTRFQQYLTKFRNIIANNPTDFTKPEHILNEYIGQHYTKEAQSDIARYNLTSKSVVSIAKKYAGKEYCTGKWLRIVSGIFAGVFGVTLLTQLRFGRILHPENIKKQVNND